MPRVTHGELSFVVPEGWEDASIITLLAPVPEQVQMLRVKQHTTERPNIVLSRRPVGDTDLDLDIFADGQERMMESLLEDLEVTDRGTLTLGGEGGVSAVTREFTFKGPEGGRMQQIQAYFIVGDTAFILTGTGSLDLTFQDVKREFLALCETLEPA